ncbi:MAG: hypothetical protein EB060_12370, partial [Proteobacteria bacterium]|nr:hypothetical protein [Pseudomonadota bacterium]
GTRASCPQLLAVLIRNNQVSAVRELSTFKQRISPARKRGCAGMGKEATPLMTTFIARPTHSHTVIHPFCGQGMLLATVETVGLSSVGVERSPKRARIARSVGLT